MAGAGFFGATSFLAVFAGAPEIINTHPLSSPIAERGLQNGTQPLYQMQEIELIKILFSQFDTHELLIKEYYERSYFIAVPTPIILRALSRTRQFIKDIELDDHNDESKVLELAARITKNTAGTIAVSASTSFEEFLDLFSGQVCRWEFIGLMFAIAGFGAVNFPDRISPQPPFEGSSLRKGPYAANMLAASDACIGICERHSNLNDILIWLRYSHAVLASHLLGDMSKILPSLTMISII